jgi:hypothetical protein
MAVSRQKPSPSLVKMAEFEIKFTFTVVSAVFLHQEIIPVLLQPANVTGFVAFSPIVS